MFRDDGSPAHVKTSGRPFFDSDSRFLGYRGVATDITAEIQRRVEIRLSPEVMRWIGRRADDAEALRNRGGV